MKSVLIDMESFVSDKSLLKPLYDLGTVEIYNGYPLNEEEALKRAEGADVILFGLMQFENKLIDKLDDLKILQFVGTGVWNFVDVDYAAKKGIKVLNIEGYGNNAVAEFAIACAFNLARKISKADRLMRNEIWDSSELEGMEISGSTFGVVGTGNIGRLVAEKASALGAKVLACDIYKSEELEQKYGVEYVSMERIFLESDIISLHLKATEETYKIIDEKYINSMKSNAFLINVARAELVDNEALYRALINKKIGGAAIDVYECEPPKEFKMSKLDNVISTPHVGFYSGKATDNSVKMAIDSVIKHINA